LIWLYASKMPNPLIVFNSSQLMKGKWLFDTGEGLTCMSTQQQLMHLLIILDIWVQICWTLTL
jgi:hypothetical protein